MRIFNKTSFDFVGNRRKAYIVSSILLLISIASLFTRGLEAGIDFLGGTEIVIEASQPIPVQDIRSELTAVFDGEPEVKLYGSESTYLVRTTAGGDVSGLQESVSAALSGAFPEASISIPKVDSVGPRFAEDLKRGALYAVLASLFVIFVYIMFRFEWRYGLGAVAALAHDVIITMGAFSLLAGVVPFSLQIDQTIIAAFLTIVGYSINDTVVVFDRIRETLGFSKTKPLEEVINRSINDTLSRTVITSGTTLLVVLVLFIFGGEVLRGFAFALSFGIVIGTFSSIFVASPVLLEMKRRQLVAQ